MKKRGMLFIGDIPGKDYNSYWYVNETDNLEDMYKKILAYTLTHVGAFKKEKGIFQ